MSCGDFKGLMRFRQSLLFISSLKKTKGDFAHRVLGSVEHTIAIAILGPHIRGLAAFFGDL